ncbi:twitch domain-containing radical SAM protein [Bacteriovorax sp. Seq25_V]|uniref:twitch domain-containing radical SAM protein n=1 Tax=Bacteriovorax sp. Seq25_V TaxID=1201288 RepID=UPI00038A2EA1|nr:twitch domain-containing radical SAM protein [Bacteriovorax sp. Seq25_V]EQC45700.1 hypothetical protein M900_1837 [Bacteriovorax sp. Seq25_V]
MGKKYNESNTEYRDRVINSISPSFCAAKWFNATIWLNNGTTASCHHPPAHRIIDFENGESFDDLKKNPSMIHNTSYKKLVRKQMLDGVRPKECEYCWKIEDISNEHVSDRVFKTVIYEEDDIKLCQTKYRETENVDLKTLEIAFDANCNFACSYCNSSFSTAWQKDIVQNGIYKNLVSDGAKAYQHDGSWARQYKKDDENPYVQAFWDWWPQLSKEISELRVTGGEATISPDFWRLVEWWKTKPDSDIQFAVNTNLGVQGTKLDELIDASHSIKKFVIYTSCEATGEQAEYIRDGLVWDEWKKSVDKLLTHGNVKEFNVMMTINSLCLYSITDFMDYCNSLKKKYGRFHGVYSLNILRFPSFMSPGTLPLELRKERSEHIKKWLNSSADIEVMHEMEIDAVKRLISYLEEIGDPHRGVSSLQSRQRDLKSFFSQYDLRRKNKNFTRAFPELASWYDSIPLTDLGEDGELVSGDSTLGWGIKEELKELAKAEGWVLSPQMSNPGSKDYIDEQYQLDDLVEMEIKNLQAVYIKHSKEKLDESWSKQEIIKKLGAMGFVKV